MTEEEMRATPMYYVGVIRSYGVTVEAEDPEKAQELAAFFLGSHDASSDEERVRFNFKIQRIELTENDTFLIH